MTFSPLALILIPAGCLFLWPLVDRWLRGGEAGALQIALTSFALSIGGLALVLFWAGMLPGRWLSAPLALAVVVAGLGAGLALNRVWFAPRRWWAYWHAQLRRLARFDAPALLTGAVIGVLVVVLINALYFPFIGDDVLVRYGPQAQAIYAAGRIPESVWGYPPLVPLGFVATWFAAGSPNEHLARLLPAVMAAGMLGAAYLIARQVYGRLAGLVAAALAALTPLFVNNATLAYTDIPTAFPLALAVFYALRWWASGRGRDAALVGVLTGVALLTKQSALTFVASFAVLPLLWLTASCRALPASWRRRVVVGLAGILLPPLVIAAPWYVRNAVIGGPANVLPVAGQYHLLGASLNGRGLLPPLMWPQAFSLPLAPLYALGWLVGIALAAQQGWYVLRGVLRGSPPHLWRGGPGGEAPVPVEMILALAVLPYWLAWWLRFSFDPRFLLLVLPFMAVWLARPLLWIARWAAEHIRLSRPVWQVGGALLLAGLLLLGARDRLGGVYRAVTQPFASDEEKLLAVKGTMYRLALFARDNLDPQHDRLYLMDERLAYYLRDFDVQVGYPLRLADLAGFDYLFHSSSIYSVYGDGLLGWEDSEFYLHAFDPAVFEPVYEVEGVHVMRILRTDLPPDGS